MSYEHPRLYDMDKAEATRKRYALFAKKSYHARDGAPYSVFVDDANKEAVVAFRGTRLDMPEDLSVDLDVAAGTESQNARFREAANVATRMQDYYRRKGYSTTFTGHSLGGNLALYAANATGNSSKAYAFNPGMPPPGLGVFLRPVDPRKDNVTLQGTALEFGTELYNKLFGKAGVPGNRDAFNQVFRIKGDPLSSGSLSNSYDDDTIEYHDLERSRAVPNPHTIDNFL